ncbi:uncharacterized protein LOC133197362 isoform X2 [Saccostrea echinata]|uniref:uncharacterized protein LOC133197362 isoform X2 n=1 Tax=Saccostrea echinata TaxID=191078 RepID=UPI002A825F24|nr:uncharacterized protein LOC133197362 isoform X2 [Saccostrea echinata]
MAACTRNVRVDEDDNQPYRKCSTATIRSEGTGTQYYSKHGGIQHMYDSSDTGSLDSFKSTSSYMRIRRVSSSVDGSSRFPKLLECAHFHYDVVELPGFQVSLCDEEQENFHHVNGEEEGTAYLIKITCGNKSWMVKRTLKNFCMLDRQLHKCIFDRKFSRLPDLQKSDEGSVSKEMELFLQSYLKRFSDIAGSMINCGSVLNWFEIDNRGNRLLVVDDSGINTPAIAAAHAVKRYTSQAIDEISLEVGDIVSVIDMPSIEDTIWWRGKRGFEVGFFPAECVEVIGDKIPASVQSMVPVNSNIVRKHGKFLTFLRMFFSTRPPRNQLKQSGIVKERVFGCDLGEHLLNSGHDVPLVLKCCSAFIEEMGIVDGIYRLSGITSNIQKLRLAFDEDRVPDLTEEIYLQDIHCISSLLKMYFRELPNPLLTYQLYDKFAEAVRDEDNKLWKIHDVVQQLPPPHYRTTEFLMRHLAKVAAFGKETGMHSKNLAIVWAPNLLRSKELECGGGAAALQGVGIQAVVTECLIVYADLIFSDKLPSYSSPDLKPLRKKPRPKSLAISTPTKLITLEEARERALSASLRPPHQKYIDVGSGPKGLPEKYHTVLDLPGYRKKVPLKEVGNLKTKKSPSGWRSIFSKGNRQSSMKHKNHKSGLSQSLGTGMERKAITEEDVQTWKRRRLRGAKSAESLLVLQQSSSIDSTKRMSRLVDENMLMKMFQEEESRRPLGHKRSLSSESPRNLIHTEEIKYPSYIVAGSREMAIDVDNSKDGIENENPDKRKQKQNFVRSEPKRRVVSHRRTPSAPLSPKMDESREKSRSPKMSKQKGISQSVVEIEHRGTEGLRENLMSSSIDAEKFVLHMDDKDLLRPIDQKGKSPSNDSHKGRHSKSPQRDSKEMSTSPKEHKKITDKSYKSQKKEEVIDLPESPGARRKNWLSSSSSTPSTTPDEPPPQHYFSRHHDYAEITDSSENEVGNNTQSSSCLRAEENVNRLSDSYDNVDNGMFYLPSDDSDLLQSIDQATNLKSINQAANNSVTSYSYSESETKFSSVEFHQSRTEEQSKMSKCLSVPSDIQKSLENLTSGSQTDLLSSITLSEVSTSIDSFSLGEENSSGLERKRRSASLDSLTESPLTRTLIEINAQIDQAFKKEVQKAKKLKEEKSLSIDSGDFKEEIATSINESAIQDSNTFVDRPAAEVQVVETPRLIRAPLRSAKDKNFSLNVGQSAESTNNSSSSYHSKTQTPEEHLVTFSSVQQVHSASSESRIFSPQESPKQTQKGYASSLPTMSPVSSPIMGRTGSSPLTSPVQRRLKRSQPNTPTQPCRQDSPVSSPGAARGGFISPMMSPTSPDQPFECDSQQRKLSRRGKVTFDLSDDDLYFLAQQGMKRETLTRTDSNSSSSTVSSLSSPEARLKQSSRPENSQSAVPKQSAKRDFPHLLLSSASTDSKSTSSPRSPRNQPRWEDLAGLNQDFRAMAGLDKSPNKPQGKASKVKPTTQVPSTQECQDSFDKKLHDLSNFNELWKNQLAPTGDVCRLNDNKDNVHSDDKHLLKRSATMPAVMEVPKSSNHRERTPECSTDERTVVEEKPMIKKCLTDCDLPQIKHCSIVTQGSCDTSSSSEMHLSESGASLMVHEESIDNQFSICRTDSYNRAVGHSAERNGIEIQHKMDKSESGQKVNKVHKIDGKEVVLNMPVLPPLELSGFPKFENTDEVPITGASKLTCDKSDNASNRNDLLGGEASFPVNLSDSYYDNSEPMPYGMDNTEMEAMSNTDITPFGGHSSMMNEIDINESCFGIPTHQNLSNEMRERMQDRFKAMKGQDTCSSLNDDVQSGLVHEFPDHLGIDERYDHPHGMEVEASVIASGYTSITRPAEDIRMLSQGPLITAEPFVVEQIEPYSQMVKHIDNSEEEAQNAINADKELNMTLQSSLNQNAYFIPSRETETAMETDVCSGANGPLPQLPPPEQEFLEVRRPFVMKSKKDTLSSEGSSERGENEVIVEHRASFKKKAPVPLPKRTERKQAMELVDVSDLNDDVFVDDIKSNITRSKLVSRVQHKSVAERGGNFSSLDDPPNRSSLDESVLQLASSRHDNFTADNTDQTEDVRFTKAHKSAKLQSLKELFEKSCKESEKHKKPNPSSQESLVCLPNQQNTCDTYRVVNARASFGKQKSLSQIEQSCHEQQFGACSVVSDSFNVPGNRRSISTDVGYEFQFSKSMGIKSEKIDKSVGIGKPPKHRSVSRNRTGSESSMCEADQRTRSSPRSVDGSPKFAREGSLSSKSSPKSQRDSSPFSQISSDDSPRGIRRCSEESSPRSIRHHQSSGENSPVVLRVRSDGSPRGTRHVSFQSHNQSFTSTQDSSGKSKVVVSSEKSERMTKSCSVLNTSSPGASRGNASEDVMSRSLTLEHSQSLEETATHLKRRGSIKELMQFFENKREGNEEEPRSNVRQRVHSESPTLGLGRSNSRSSESLTLVNVRHSLELPSTSVLSTLEGISTPQPVRIGPKPFYSVKNN